MSTPAGKPKDLSGKETTGPKRMTRGELTAHWHTGALVSKATVNFQNRVLYQTIIPERPLFFLVISNTQQLNEQLIFR